MQVIFHFPGGPAGLEKGIASLTFSPSGARLAGVAVDDNHKVGIYDTEVGAILAVDKGDTAKIIDLKFKSDTVKFIRRLKLILFRNLCLLDLSITRYGQFKISKCLQRRVNSVPLTISSDVLLGTRILASLVLLMETFTPGVEIPLENLILFTRMVWMLSMSATNSNFSLQLSF